MTTQITSKQIKIINDINFNNKEIENAKIDINKNKIENIENLLNAGSNILIEGSTISAIVPTKVSDLENDSQYITNAVDDLVNYTPTTNLASVALSGDYNDLFNKPIIDSELSDSSTNAVQNKIITEELTRIENLTATNASNIILEINNRQNADNNLQNQIDALTVASDVTDIVGTYQDLQNYDTQHLKDNDIIKVLQDNTHNNASSYYRWNDTTEQFNYIGSEGPYYTKSESEEKFVPQTTLINGIGLSNNITLTKNDIGLNNVDNTSDFSKPISTATQNALDLKQNISGMTNYFDNNTASNLQYPTTKAVADYVKNFNGVYYPKNNNELNDILENAEENSIIDFVAFKNNWNNNGYVVENKNFVFRNLRVNNYWQNFDYFQKPLFEFIDAFPTFQNCSFIIHDIDLDGVSEVAPLLKFSTTNGNEYYQENRFENCRFDIRNISNVTDLNIVEVKDVSLTVKDSQCFFQADNIDNATFIISNTVNAEIPYQTIIEIAHSSLEVINANTSCHIIKYSNINKGSILFLRFSALNAGTQNGNTTIIVPNYTQMTIEYCKLSNITCIESSETFNEWTVGTSYNQGDSIKLTEPGSGNVRYFKVLKSFTPQGYEWWIAMANGDIEYYYQVNADCVLSDVGDQNNRINLNFQATTGVNNLVVENQFNCNNTNRFYIRMQDQNINGGNDTDVLHAISELANRVAYLEQNV